MIGLTVGDLNFQLDFSKSVEKVLGTLVAKTLGVKGEACKGGKLAKERVTVLLTCSSTGEKLKPLVIGKVKNPRCFKNINIDNLPVYWESNKKA